MFTEASLMAAGGKKWEKDGYSRIYFDPLKYLSNLTEKEQRRIAHVKIFYDCQHHIFDHTTTYMLNHVQSAIAAIQAIALKNQ
jgi:hypothetical protein